MASGTFPIHNPLGFQQMVDITSATAPTVPTGARRAVISVEGHAARWRDDGTSPTASVGNRIVVDSTYEFTGDLDQLEFIEEGVDCKINISYYSN